jgi:hypothetical protein
MCGLAVCEWFGLKTTRTVFTGLASKPVATVSSGLASKPVATVFSSLTSKLVATVSPGLASKPAVSFLVEHQNQDERVNAMGCVEPCYPCFAVFFLLDPRGVVVI